MTSDSPKEPPKTSKAPAGPEQGLQSTELCKLAQTQASNCKADLAHDTYNSQTDCSMKVTHQHTSWPPLIEIQKG